MGSRASRPVLAPRERGARFASQRLAECYAHRPCYSPEVFGRLRTLVCEPRILLDAGAGDGRIARRLASEMVRVDAVDPSLEMIAVGKAAPGGASSNLRWIESRMEDAALDSPYGLATAGASFHWMDPDIVLPMLADALAPDAVLALIDGDAPVDAAFEDAISRVMRETITRADGSPPAEWLTVGNRLERPMLEHARYEPRGVKITEPFPVEQSVEDFLRCEHSRQSFSEDHLRPELCAFFDDAMREALEPYAVGGRLRYAIRTRVEWGRPI